jgi:hypothetical protein
MHDIIRKVALQSTIKCYNVLYSNFKSIVSKIQIYLNLKNTFFINLFSPDGLDFKKVESVRTCLSFHEIVLSVQNKLDLEE